MWCAVRVNTNRHRNTALRVIPHRPVQNVVDSVVYWVDMIHFPTFRFVPGQNINGRRQQNI